jgi:hypothetical protein
MLLAEALAARKDAITRIDDLRGRLTSAALRYEDQERAGDDPADVVARLGATLDRFESLTVRINRTNNATRLTFDERDLSLMEAIALRERLVLEAKARRGAVEAVEAATGAGGTSRSRGWLGTRRTKDDVREVPTVDLAAERRAADRLSEAVRRLDLALQQRNWTTELLE